MAVGLQVAHLKKDEARTKVIRLFGVLGFEFAAQVRDMTILGRETMQAFTPFRKAQVSFRGVSISRR